MPKFTKVLIVFFLIKQSNTKKIINLPRSTYYRKKKQKCYKHNNIQSEFKKTKQEMLSKQFNYVVL